MPEYIKLLIMAVPVTVVLVLIVRGLYRYNPDGDKCEHGVRGGEGFDCDRCDGRVYEVKVYSEEGLVDEYLAREGEPESVKFLSRR